MWMTKKMSHLKSCVFALLFGCLGALASSVAAQGLFDTAVRVNDSVITEFEIEQRQRFLTLLNAPDASRDAVLEELINERLRAEAVSNAGLELSEEALIAGREEFAQRVNLSVDEFVTVLEESGVARETFDAFVSNGIAWRDFIRARFGRRLEVSEAEIDQALGSTRGVDTIRVLVSEIIIPAPEDRLAEVEELAELIASSQSQAEFSDYARQYSATATRDEGGRLPWQPLSNLPPVLRPLLLGLAPGEVTDPITIPNAIALFQLRDIQETGAPVAEYAAIDYATYYIPGGRSQAALAQATRLRSEVDVCDDLFGVAQGQPPEVLERSSKPPSEIPTDIAMELSKLDAGESSVALTRANGQTLVFLMLCGRTAAANEEVAREEVAASLRSSRLTAIAESYLEQLRADARIRLQ
jgi:peptidyl-prolyl cis-trans isomerase SurA